MVHKVLQSTVVILVLISPAKSQSNENSIGFNIGFTKILNQDFLASPFLYKGTAFQFGITYAYTGKKIRHYASVELLNTKLNSTISGSLGNNSHVSEIGSFMVKYNYQYLVANVFSGKGQIFVGPEINFLFTLREYDYGRGQPNETIAEVFTSFSPASSLEYALDGNTKFSYQASFALLSYGFRNPYSLQSDKVGDVATKDSYAAAYFKLSEWKSVNQLVYWDNRIAITHAVSKRFNVEGQYRFSLNNFSEPFQSKTVKNTFLAGLRYKF
jgi:hypothetical protein